MRKTKRVLVFATPEDKDKYHDEMVKIIDFLYPDNTITFASKVSSVKGLIFDVAFEMERHYLIKGCDSDRNYFQALKVILVLDSEIERAMNKINTTREEIWEDIIFDIDRKCD